MSGAGAAVEAAAATALAAIEGLGVHRAAPVQAALPHAIVDAGFEADWGHKSGAGREVRLAVTVRDGGESPERLRRLMAAAEDAVAAIGPQLGGWRIIALVQLRSRIVREARAGATGGWAGAIDFRARLLAEDG